MKKFIKILTTIIFFIILCAIGLTIYVCVSINDKTNDTPEEIVNDNMSLSEVMNMAVYKGLNDTKESGVCDFSLSSTDLNYLLYAISQSIDIKAIDVKSMYATFNDDSTIDFYMPVKALFLSTCLKGDLEIKEENNNFTININELSAGKLTSDNFFVEKLILNRLDLNKIEENLSNQGVYLDLEVEGRSLIIEINEENFKKTIMHFISQVDSEDSKLYIGIFDTILAKDDFINFKFNQNSETGFDLDFNEINLNAENYLYSLENKETNLSVIKEKVKILLEANTITSKSATTVFNFLVRGFDNINEDDQNAILKFDLTSIGILNEEAKRSYQGIIDRTTLTLKDYFDNDLLDFTREEAIDVINGNLDIAISEETFNEILNNLSFIGSSFAFTYENDLSYVCVESLNVEFLDNELIVNVLLDFNGYEILVSADFSTLESETVAIEGTLNSLKLGNLETTDTAKVEIISYLETILSDVDFISFDSETLKVKLSFENYINSQNNQIIKFLFEAATSNETKISGDNDGEIQIKFFSLTDIITK